MCCLQVKGKQLLVIKHSYHIVAHRIETGECVWSYYLFDFTIDGLAVDGCGELLACHRSNLYRITGDGVYKGYELDRKKQGIYAARKAYWSDESSSLILAHQKCKANWYISVLKKQ